MTKQNVLAFWRGEGTHDVVSINTNFESGGLSYKKTRIFKPWYLSSASDYPHLFGNVFTFQWNFMGLWFNGSLFSSNYFPFRVQQTIKSFRPTLLLQITAVHFSASAVCWVIDRICSANIRQDPREIWDGWKLNCPSLSLAGSSCHKPWRYFNLVIGTQTFSSCLKALKWWEITASARWGYLR